MASVSFFVPRVYIVSTTFPVINTTFPNHIEGRFSFFYNALVSR